MQERKNKDYTETTLHVVSVYNRFNKITSVLDKRGLSKTEVKIGNFFTMSIIYVDADACPVKEEVLRVAYRHDLEVYIVSNGWWRQNVGPKIHRIMVAAGVDSADNWIVEHIGEGDMAVTADILLADRCLKKNAAVINPNGKLFTEANIGMAIAMRELGAHLRETGEITGHTPCFSKQYRSRFLETLENIVQKRKG